MSDVAAEMGLSEAAIHRYTGSKEDLFVPAIRHSLSLEVLATLIKHFAVAAGGR